MDRWLARFRCSLEDGELLRGASRVLIGVSGGPDSMALLCLFTELRDTGALRPFPDLLAGHVHHGLRGREADLDEQLVRDAAQARGIECLVVRGDVAGVAARKRLSREVAARAIRYEAFRGWSSERGVDAIALAHHLDDQAETVLLRAARGTGIRGLAGIPRERRLGEEGETRIIRPLLGWRRVSLLEFLAERGQSFRSDESNKDLGIPRNVIRHEVLPTLEGRVHPGVAASLARLAAIAGKAAEDSRLLGARALEEARITWPGSGVRLSVGALRRWPPTIVHEALSLALLEAFSWTGRELSWRTTQVVRGWIAGGGPAEARLDLAPGGRSPGAARIELRYGILCITAAGEPLQPGEAVSLAIPGSVLWLGWKVTAHEEAVTALENEASGCLERVDADRVREAGGLCVRSRREGERFWPLGASGPKKLKEFFRERRVPPEERDGAPLVSAGGEIVWVVGHRIGQPFRLTGETRAVLVLEAARVAGGQ